MSALDAILSIEQADAWDEYLADCREAWNYEEHETWFWAKLQGRLAGIDARAAGRGPVVVLA